MGWRAAALMAAALAGCSRPNPLFNIGIGGPGVDSAADQTAPDQGRPLPDGGPDGYPGGDPGGGSDVATVEAPSAETLDLPPVGPDLWDAGPPADTSPPLDVSPPSSLVGYWKLNDMGGTQARDSSGSAYHGALEGITAVNWDFSPRGGGLRFDRAPGDGVRVGEVNAVPPKIQTLAHFTIAAWTFRVAGNTGLHQSIMSRQLIGNTEVFNLTFDNEFVKFYIYPQLAGATMQATAELTTGRAGGDWIHVAATYDGAFMRLYLDGVEAPGAVAYTGMLRPSQFPLYIGTNKNDPAEHQPFDGILDEVMLFSEALDGAAIRRLRDGELANL
jgi:hypothetical protein